MSQVENRRLYTCRITKNERVAMSQWLNHGVFWLTYVKKSLAFVFLSIGLKNDPGP